MAITLALWRLRQEDDKFQASLVKRRDMRKGDGVDKDMVWGRGEKREVRDGRRECEEREKRGGGGGDVILLRLSWWF